MRKRIISLIMAVIMLLSLCIVVVASDHTVVKKAADVAEFNVDSEGKQEDHLTIECSGLANNEQYLLLVLKRKLDTEGNLVNVADEGISSIDPDDILYINQIESDSAGEVRFAETDKVYPKLIADSAVYLTGKGLASAKLLATIKAGYTLGDADSDGDIDIYDAVMVAKYEAELPLDGEINLAACEVDGEPGCTIYDAVLIAKYEAELIDKFPVQE